MKIGDRIKYRRIELGYTVDELAKKIGKNRATIYRYENNEIENLPTTVLEPLAKALNVSPAYLMGWEDELEEEQDNEDIPEEILVLARGAKTLTKDQFKLVSSLIDQFNKENED